MPPHPQREASDFVPEPTEGRKDGLFPPWPEPVNGLQRYRLLSPTASVRVSPLCLGAMSIGNQWSSTMVARPSIAECEAFLDAYYNAGGNFIDTASSYHDEQSEMIIGEWMEKRQIRSELVIASKYTAYGKNRHEGNYRGIAVNFGNTSKKTLRIVLDEALQRLRTDYIDLYYVHFWDFGTSIPEVMQARNEVVRLGKVLYIGISDTPAWIVSQANEYARQQGLAQFVIYQGRFSLACRDFERDIIPMCRANGMSIAPYGVLGQGKFKTPEELKARADAIRGGAPPTDEQLHVAAALQEVANEIGGDVSLTSVALAWVRQAMQDCFPIVGGLSATQLQSNIEALDVSLTVKQIETLNRANPFDLGFPSASWGTDPRVTDTQRSTVIHHNLGGHTFFPKMIP